MSDTGTLAYVAVSPRRFERQLVWADSKGNVEALPAPQRGYTDPLISPDGRFVAFSLLGPLQFDPGLRRDSSDARAVDRGDHWQQQSVPGLDTRRKRVAYRATRGGYRNLFWKAADGSDDEERLTTSEDVQTPRSWTPDAQYLAFASGSDLWVWSAADRQPHAYLKTPSPETSPAFSPDGRWLAYSSSESGAAEVYVRPFPGPGGRLQISTSGTEPVWRATAASFSIARAIAVVRCAVRDRAAHGRLARVLLKGPTCRAIRPAPATTWPQTDASSWFDPLNPSSPRRRSSSCSTGSRNSARRCAAADCGAARSRRSDWFLPQRLAMHPRSRSRRADCATCMPNTASRAWPCRRRCRRGRPDSLPAIRRERPQDVSGAGASSHAVAAHARFDDRAPMPHPPQEDAPVGFDDPLRGSRIAAVRDVGYESPSPIQRAAIRSWKAATCSGKPRPAPARPRRLLCRS